VRTAIAFAILAAAAVAGCSSGHPAAAPPALASTTAAPSAPASSPTAKTAKVIDGNITIAPADGKAPGPMKITPVYCGKFTTKQQGQYGTRAAGGFVYKVTNQSNTLVGAAKVDVDFISGTTVLADNVTADLVQISPGRSSTGEVDALGDSGSDLKFTSCEVMWYAVITSDSVDPVTYAG
jgi:hypothetical protein